MAELHKTNKYKGCKGYIFQW